MHPRDLPISALCCNVLPDEEVLSAKKKEVSGFRQTQYKSVRSGNRRTQQTKLIRGRDIHNTEAQIQTETPAKIHRQKQQ